MTEHDYVDPVEAEETARTLLFRELTPSQRWMYTHQGYFTVQGSVSGRTHFLYKDGGVGDVNGTYCVRSTDWSLPPADILFGYLLMIRTDEPRWLRTINHNGAYFPSWTPDRRSGRHYLGDTAWNVLSTIVITIWAVGLCVLCFFSHIPLVPSILIGGAETVAGILALALITHWNQHGF